MSHLVCISLFGGVYMKNMVVLTVTNEERVTNVYISIPPGSRVQVGAVPPAENDPGYETDYADYVREDEDEGLLFDEL